MIMHVYHVTHRDNLASIQRIGLDPLHARGKRLAVWLCHPEKLHWAVAHVCTRHDWRECSTVVLRVPVEAVHLKLHATPGLFWVPDLIPTADLHFSEKPGVDLFEPLRQYTPEDDTRFE